jgi:two-component system response regulator AtoC
MAKILIVDDEESVRRVLCIQIRRMGHEAEEAENGLIAWQKLLQADYETVISDLKMPEMDGLELLQKIRNQKPQIPVIMITAHGTIDTAVEAMKRGAFDYVTKPFNQEEFLKTVERAILSAQAISKEFQRSRSFLRQEEKIIGSTPEIEKVYETIEKVAQSDSNVLITGEEGVGKDVVARLLHDKSDRRTSPLVRAYLSACPPSEQIEKLFGGSDKEGWFQLAEKGTLYLDEIGALSADAQAKLVEVLGQSVPCRIVSSTDFNLLEKVEKGLFRKDLFYTLNVIPIHVPPLRERTQDIEPLVDHFIRVFSKKFQKNVKGIADEALLVLIQAPWPGNIRELENVIEFAVNISDGPIITKNHLPPQLFGSPYSPKSQWNESQVDVLKQKVDSLEKEAIVNALKSSQGDVLRASQKLGVPPSLLEDKVRILKISTVR